MTRDYFIIMVYCLICEHYQAVIAQHPLRRRGFPPALIDEEVITIETCGGSLGSYGESSNVLWFSLTDVKKGRTE